MKTDKFKLIKIDKKVIAGAKIAIIRSEFNGGITKSLEDACLSTLFAYGVAKKQVLLYTVPGSLEIPIMALNVVKKKPSVIIALGVIIKGDTYHFELISNECARGCMEVSLRYNVPIIYEVISAYNLLQARKRAGREGNRGEEAALSALKILESLRNAT